MGQILKKVRTRASRAPLATFFAGTVAALLLLGLGYGGFFLHTGSALTLLSKGEFNWSRFYYERGSYYFGGGAYNIDYAQKYFVASLSLPGAEDRYQHYQLGRVYFIKGYLHDALNEFNKEEIAHPDFKRVHYARGLTYAYLDRLNESIEDFKAFLEWKPQSWAAHNDLVWVYFRKGDFINAEKYAREGLTFSPDNAWLSNSLGTALLNLGNYKEAKEHLLKAQIGFNGMTKQQWGAAYPGNDPRIYEQGFEATKKSVANNLALVEAKLVSE